MESKQRDAGALPYGVVASSVTPFNQDGDPDISRVHLHIDWLIEQGIAGISPLGSSGEFPALEYADRLIIENVAETLPALASRRAMFDKKRRVGMLTPAQQ